MSVRTTIILDDTVAKKLKSIVPPRKLSHFINNLIEEKIDEIERRELIERMKEGYLATRKDRRQLNEDWDPILAENWE